MEEVETVCPEEGGRLCPVVVGKEAMAAPQDSALCLERGGGGEPSPATVCMLLLLEVVVV